MRHVTKDEMSRTESWEKSIPGGGNSKCKGPEVGTYLVSPRRS